MLEFDDPMFDEARALHRRVGGVVDMHVDSIIQQRLFRYNVQKRHGRPMAGMPFFWHADLPRMREAGYGGALMGIHYWPWQSERGWRECNKQIDYLDHVAAIDPLAMRIKTPEDWDVARREGVVGLSPGVEGAHQLNHDIGRVEALARRRISYLTLVHFSKNFAATPSMGRGSNEDEGLTQKGEDLVKALNQWGVAIDLAHVNTPGVLDVCKITQAPVLCTHTGVKGVRVHPRNITDGEIDAIAKVGGTIGVMFSSNFLTKGLRGRCAAIVEHLDYIVQRVGPEHASIGSDFDGWIPLMRDQRDCLDLVKVTHGLMKRGYKERDLALILRENTLRVLKGAWEARSSH